MWTYISETPAATMKLGQELGKLLQPGDFLALNGQLGSGKTLFVKGLATGLNINPELVTSPTFAFIQEYSGSLPLYHFDVYRLDYPEQLEDLGYEDYFFGRGVTVVEWAEQVAEYWPGQYLLIQFERIHDDTRRLCLKPHGVMMEQCVAQLKERMRVC